jgi:hypothetical protein
MSGYRRGADTETYSVPSIENRRIVIIGVRATPHKEEREQKLDTGIFKHLMGLCQKRQTEFFEIDEIEDVKHKVFEFRIEPFQTGDLLHDVVIVFQKLPLLHHLGEFTLDFPFAGEKRRAHRHVNVLTLANRFVQSGVKRITLIETHIVKIRPFFKFLFDLIGGGVGEIEIEVAIPLSITNSRILLAKWVFPEPGSAKMRVFSRNTRSWSSRVAIELLNFPIFRFMCRSRLR